MIATSSVCVSGSVVLMAVIVLTVLFMVALAFVGVMYGRVKSTGIAVGRSHHEPSTVEEDVTEILEEQGRLREQENGG